MNDKCAIIEDFDMVLRKIDKEKDVESFIVKSLGSSKLEEFKQWSAEYILNNKLGSMLDVELLYTCVDAYINNEEVKSVYDSSFSELRELLKDAYRGIGHELSSNKETSLSIKSKFGFAVDFVDSLLRDDKEDLKTQAAILQAYFEIRSRLKYSFQIKPMFTDKKILRITKIKSYSVYFDYGYDKFFLHNTDGDDMDSMVLYRRYPLGNGKYELQYMSSTRGVRCSDIEYGKFNPHKRGTTYKDIDLDKFLIWLQYHDLICGYSTKRIDAIKKKNEERKQEIILLEKMIRKLRCEIRELKE